MDNHRYEWCHVCKDPSLWKENKSSSRAEDDTKSAEVKTCEIAYRRNLSGGQSSEQKNFGKQSVILCYYWCNNYALLGVILWASWCNVMSYLV